MLKGNDEEGRNEEQGGDTERVIRKEGERAGVGKSRKRRGYKEIERPISTLTTCTGGGAGREGVCGRVCLCVCMYEAGQGKAGLGMREKHKEQPVSSAWVSAAGTRSPGLTLSQHRGTMAAWLRALARRPPLSLSHLALLCLALSSLPGVAAEPEPEAKPQDEDYYNGYGEYCSVVHFKLFVSYFHTSCYCRSYFHTSYLSERTLTHLSVVHHE